jgi:hypothetical protein
MRNSVHPDFERNRYLLLDLFGRDSGPLSDDFDVVVGNVRICLNRQRVKGNQARNKQNQREQTG